MTIDPGLNGTGWVIFNGRDPEFLANGVIFSGKVASWNQRALNISHALCAIMTDNEVKKVYCEYPAYFDSAAGQMVAKRGDLLKLTFLVGCIQGFLEPTFVHLLPVHTWKGQLPKEVVKSRIKNLLGKDICRNLKSHDWDACGMGLFLQGHINRG